MSGPESDNWVRVRAECTPSGFLRKLRAEICQDVIEANKQFEPEKSFSLSSEAEPCLRVNRCPKGETEADAFVSFKPNGESTISVSLHYRNGGTRALYAEQPIDEIVLDWDHTQHQCTITVGEKTISTLQLRRGTLGKLFFGE